MPFWKENVKNFKAREEGLDDGRDGAYPYSEGCLNVYEVTPPKKPPPSATVGVNLYNFFSPSLTTAGILA
jgi:hypothetical protein